MHSTEVEFRLHTERPWVRIMAFSNFTQKELVGAELMDFSALLRVRVKSARIS